MEARGTYRKATKNCPILESKSNIKCVIGSDRLDCMRRISKGTAHFGVFSPEELLAAKWSGADVLITSEMRFNDGKFVWIMRLFTFCYVNDSSALNNLF